LVFEIYCLAGALRENKDFVDREVHALPAVDECATVARNTGFAVEYLDAERLKQHRCGPFFDAADRVRETIRS
jgi:hypothetical protein